jgi:hypothetical protein
VVDEISPRNELIGAGPSSSVAHDALLPPLASPLATSGSMRGSRVLVAESTLDRQFQLGVAAAAGDALQRSASPPVIASNRSTRQRAPPKRS